MLIRKLKETLKRSVVLGLAIVMLMTSQPNVLAEQSSIISKASSNVLPVYLGDAIQVSMDEKQEISEGKQVTVQVEVPEDAAYAVQVTYHVNDESLLPVEMAFLVNGEAPYEGLKNLLFESQWVNKEAQEYDRYGNEVTSLPTKADAWLKTYITDPSHRQLTPYAIDMKKGQNTLTLDILNGNLSISEISLEPITDLATYSATKVTGSELIVIEAEDMTSRNDSSIRPTSEFNVNLTPYEANKRVLNLLDGASYKKAGQKVSYTFEAPADGYYYLGTNYRQRDKVDYPVFLDIYVNGEIPFKQFQAFPMAYATSFKQMMLKDKTSNEGLAVYLKAGTNTVDLVISIEPAENAINNIYTIMDEIKALSLEVNKLTGSKKDKYRDFNLEEYIPGVEGKLVDWAARIQAIYDELAVVNADKTNIGAISSLKMARTNLLTLAKEPNELPARMSELSTGAAGNSSVMQYLANQIQILEANNLSIDKLYFFQNPDQMPDKAGIFTKIIESIKRFFYSFFEQAYSTDNTDPKHLQVWVNRPRQYVEILQKMIDESFTPETGIEVDLSIMPDQNKLILSNAAGEAPDVAQAVSYTLPYDLAIRNAICDLKQFKDYDEVADRFAPGLLIPSTVGDGVYSIPETMNFWVTFYRKDIFESLDIPVPDTLEGITQILPELQRRGMSFFYPSAGMVAMKTFAATLPPIYSSGGSFYGEDASKTTINSDASLEGFRTLTDLFLIYNAPVDVASFYQNFRSGNIPIGIGDYFVYNLLTNAAPEIANQWEIGPFPGIEDANGNINRYSTGGAENCIVFETSDKKEAAWEYLKWWTSTETQTKFGHTLVATYGKEYLWNSANLEAFADLPWDNTDKEVILAQTEWLMEAPRVPGSYMLERELSDAYNKVVIDGKKLRTSIDTAVKRINRETMRKLEEFGYIKDGVTIKKYEVPVLKKEDDDETK